MQSFKGSPSGPLVCYSVTVSVDLPNLAAQTGIYHPVAIPASPGCRTGQRVLVNPSAQILPSYGIADSLVSATNTVLVHAMNISAGALDPGAFSINFVFFGARSAA